MALCERQPIGFEEAQCMTCATCAISDAQPTHHTLILTDFSSPRPFELRENFFFVCRQLVELRHGWLDKGLVST